MRRAAVAVALVCALALAAWAGPRSMEPGPKDRCPVCGMFVAGHPSFLARLTWEDGSVAYFDGVKDLVRFRRDPAKFGGAAKGVRAVFVKDYYSLEPIDGQTAYYVVGSDVMGPMGRELIPFATLEAAEEFRRDHKGERVLRFEQIDEGVLAGLN